MPEPPIHPEPPGPPVRWETIARAWDQEDRLASECAVTTVDTDRTPPEPERSVGFYL